MRRVTIFNICQWSVARSRRVGGARCFYSVTCRRIGGLSGAQARSWLHKVHRPGSKPPSGALSHSPAHSRNT
ncbi:hypothetical protein CEXT_136381 [Caerostris extrusa]|uniref:Secreted protein n=1 Tax=Caerostris extrusa TaxID=172846 RepID=A0AAV4U268_CAEEX|nr:hypothetical protein CEXT_136381 [Caerostris extrusa]